MESNFNLATSNLDLDVALANGVRMHLRTYLSSQNHNEAYVKGGYLQVDRLDFVQEDFLGGLMDNLRFKVGHMELNCSTGLAPEKISISVAATIWSTVKRPTEISRSTALILAVAGS